MLEQPPKLWRFGIYGLIVAGLVSGAKLVDSQVLRELLIIVALVMLAIAGLEGVGWLAFVLVARYRNYREAQALTPFVRQIEAIAKLSEYQCNLILSGSPLISVMPGLPMPLKMLALGDDKWGIPFDFIDQFLALGDGDYLCPVGTWAEGTKQRKWAQLLTNHLILMGFAEKHNGNKPAVWVDRAQAYVWMGLSEEQP